MHPGHKGDEKPLYLQSWMYIQKCYGNLEQRHGTLRQFSRKKRFIVLAQTQWTRVQRLNPKNKEGLLTLHTLGNQVTEAKKQSLTHMWLHATLLATSHPTPPVLHDLLHI
jgi:hypothetical protein